jgi:NTE family protein
MTNIAHPKKASARRGGAMALPETVALVLQGGGALGSYQAGVVERMADHDIEIDWIAGISIGAINGAIIAGNPPERRVERLRAFWECTTSALPSFPFTPNDRIREALHEWSASYVALTGVPGFFTPRPITPGFAIPGSVEATSFYDSAPLRKTLDDLVDWDLVNDGPVRLSVGATNVESGNFHYFDTKNERIDARHVMASGALPPGLPPVEIDGCWWWDGGLVSNTPLSHLLDHQDDEMLVFQLDLFSATADRPKTIMDVMAREKEIRYSSRTRQISAQMIKQRKEHETIRRLLAKLPPVLADDRDAKRLAALTRDAPVNLVHLIYRANAWEGGSRDFEFSRRTMEDHWRSGREAIDHALANAQVIAETIGTGRSAAFDLERRADPIQTRTKE